MQKNNKRDKNSLPKVPPIRVELKTEQPEKGQRSPTEPTTAITSYFLKPSPEELLEQLASMENLNEEVVNEKFLQLSVLWPAYFFTLRETEDGRKSVLLDVSEDGFGVVIESEVDLGLYPQLRELAGGEKLWIGGKILAVDPAGTGTIYLKNEQLRFGAESPFVPDVQETEK